MGELENYLHKHSYQQVIDAVLDINRDVTTSDIRAYLDWDDVNRIKYRLRKIEDFGLVRLINQGDQNGRPLPLKVEITDEGREIIESYDWERREVDGQTPEERIEELEAKVESLRQENLMLRDEIEMLHGFRMKVERELGWVDE